MEHGWADQVRQGIVAFSAGENLSHDVDHSYYADEPEKDAKTFEECLHFFPSLTRLQPS